MYTTVHWVRCSLACTVKHLDTDVQLVTSHKEHRLTVRIKNILRLYTRCAKMPPISGCQGNSWKNVNILSEILKDGTHLHVREVRFRFLTASWCVNISVKTYSGEENLTWCPKRSGRLLFYPHVADSLTRVALQAYSFKWWLIKREWESGEMLHRHRDPLNCWEPTPHSPF